MSKSFYRSGPIINAICKPNNLLGVSISLYTIKTAR